MKNTKREVRLFTTECGIIDMIPIKKKEEDSFARLMELFAGQQDDMTTGLRNLVVHGTSFSASGQQAFECRGIGSEKYKVGQGERE